MSKPIWIRLRSVLERDADATSVELSRESAEEMLAEIKRLRAEVEKLRNLRAEFEKMRKELDEARQEIAKIYDEAEMTRLERL